MKALTLLFLHIILLSSCSAYESEDSDQISKQARVYSKYFHDIPHGSPPILSKFKDGELKEVFYFDFALDRVGYENYYKESLYQQFLRILKQDNSLSFIEASKHLQSDFKNYYSKDCPSISQFLLKIKSTDIQYKQKMYSLSLNSPAYKYYYKHPQLPVTYTLTTAIEEHPIAKLSKEAHKAIADCPHPKESGQL